jgi:uncharacterized cupredoxin-like copper-binding protein
MHQHKGENSFGKPGDLAKVSRTLEIESLDNMTFKPNYFEVKKGETIKIVLKNSGKLKHEIVLGDTAQLQKHKKIMMEMPDMKHNEENTATVEPGKTGDLIWKFEKIGKVNFACLIPGHSEAGMIGTIQVKK